MNNTNATFPIIAREKKDPRTNDVYYEALTSTSIILTVFVGLIIFVGVVGNILVLLVIGLEKSMRTTVNRGLFLLAIADLIVLILLPILPIGAEFLEDDSYLGEAMCYILGFYDRGAMVCSALIFVFLGFDRYFAICCPLRNRELWSARKANIIWIVIWTVSIGASVPYIFMNDYREVHEGNMTYHYCFFDTGIGWKLTYDSVLPGIVFLTPIPVLVFLYGRMIYELKKTVAGGISGETSSTSGRRGRVQVVIMLATVVSIFVVCQVPFWTLFLTAFVSSHVFSFVDSDGELVYFLVWIFRILVYVNSAVNPVVYFTVSYNFRQAFRNIFCRQKESGEKPTRRNKPVSPVSSKE